MYRNALTQLRAQKAPAGKHADGQGLWLVKSDAARGKWVLRFHLHHTRREMGLGRWPDVSIAEARDRAYEARKLVRDGVDPIRTKQPTHRMTVREAILGCFEARKAQLKGDGKAGRWYSPLKVHVIPKLGAMPIEDVSQHDLKRILEPIWHEKPEAAAKALNRINLTLRYAAAHGLDVDLQAPMKARALLGKQRHETMHIPSMPYQDVPLFYRWLTSQNTVSTRALRFLILTVARTSEIRFATTDEIDGDVWYIPGKRTKTGRDHRIPLTDEARSLLPKNGLLFPVRDKPMSDATMSSFMKRHGVDARPHGFRATFRTWVEETTDTEYEVKESALGHIVDTETVRAYQRSDRLEKRRTLMEQWTRYLLALSRSGTTT